MAIFRARKFLFCVPLRAGVCLLAVLAMLVSGPGAAGSWLEQRHTLPLRAKVAIIIQGGVFSLVFLLSIPGLIAAANGQRGAVYIYSKFLFITTPLIVLSLLVTLFTTLHPESVDFDKCLNGSKSQFIQQFCTQNGLSSVVKILPIALLGAAILTQFYAWIIAISYGEELDVSGLESKFGRYYGSNSGSDVENQRSSYPEPPFARR
ncbi:hypothetical protein C8F01DRAFT_1099602 [Mycena amicta]|nr:hypothetical protein C8F01DRAFT_1099602 [Mycena amicta]